MDRDPAAVGLASPAGGNEIRVERPLDRIPRFDDPEWYWIAAQAERYIRIFEKLSPMAALTKLQLELDWVVARDDPTGFQFPVVPVDLPDRGGSGPHPDEIAAAQWQNVRMMFYHNLGAAATFLRCHRPDLFLILVQTHLVPPDSDLHREYDDAIAQARATLGVAPLVVAVAVPPVAAQAAETPTRKRRPNRTDTDRFTDEGKIAGYLKTNPGATAEEIADATGIAKGHVVESTVWRQTMDQRNLAKQKANAAKRGRGGVGDPSTDLGREQDAD